MLRIAQKFFKSKLEDNVPAVPLPIVLLAAPNVPSAAPVLFNIKSDIFISPSPTVLLDSPNRSSIPVKIFIQKIELPKKLAAIQAWGFTLHAKRSDTRKVHL